MSTDNSLSPQQDWRDRFPWLLIGRSVSIALDFRVIILAAAALVATVAGWRVLDAVFSGSEDPTLQRWAQRHHVVDEDGKREYDDEGEALMSPDRDWPWEDKELVSPPSTSVSLIDGGWWVNTPLVGVWKWLTRPAFYMYSPGTGFAGFVCLLLSIIWAAAVWGLFAGAITRYAAVALTTDERLGWSQIFWQARARWLSYFSAPLIPIVAASLFGIPLLIAGWILHIPQVGPFLIGLAWILAIIGGVVLTVTLVPPMFGWPFMWSTISTEGSDAMDGCSRCYSYVWQRPLRFVFYLLFAGLLSWFSLLLVAFLVDRVEALSMWAVSWGAGNEYLTQFQDGVDSEGEELTALSSAGSKLLGFWTGALRLVVPAYAFGFFFTSMTAIYLLLRQQIDSAELDEVFLEHPPEPLPPMTQDSAGVATAPAEESKEPDAGGGSDS